MKITLIFPRFKYESGDPPLGLASLASYIKKYSDVGIQIIDTTFDHSFENVKKYLAKYVPNIVGIYLDTIMYNDALKIIKEVKKYNIFVVTGGPHATILPETLIDYVDIVVIGEAEKPVLRIIKNFKKRNFHKIENIWFRDGKTVIKNKITYENINLDTLPFPARGILLMEKYIERCHQFDSINPRLRATTIIVSRGCPFNCSFCQPTLRKLFGNKFRIRSPENVIAEIKAIRNRYNLNAIFFHDDTLTAKKEWIIDFCNKLQQEKLNLIYGCNTRIDTIDKNLLKIMYRAGFRELHIGIESASERIINDIYKKGLKVAQIKATIEMARKIGFNTMCFFMIGAPTETKKEIRKTVKFACSLPTNEISVSITNPIPKTNLFKFMQSNNYYISSNYTDFDYYSKKSFYPQYIKELSAKELKKIQRWFLFRFYADPRHLIYLIKHISSPKGLKKMFIKLRRFV